MNKSINNYTHLCLLVLIESVELQHAQNSIKTSPMKACLKAIKPLFSRTVSV
jgi:hypothetical protein